MHLLIVKAELFREYFTSNTVNVEETLDPTPYLEGSQCDHCDFGRSSEDDISDLSSQERKDHLASSLGGDGREVLLPCQCSGGPPTTKEGQNWNIKEHFLKAAYSGLTTFFGGPPSGKNFHISLFVWNGNVPECDCVLRSAQSQSVTNVTLEWQIALKY